ncbi:hypothetical protein F4703DRAFT_1881631 [Phycomyces blakesleeanus]
MLASELPFEIILCIARFLPIESKRCCANVCKSWKAPFKSMLWDSITIKNTKEMKNICDPAHSRHKPFKSNGKRTRSLTLDRDVTTSHVQFTHLQKLLPNIRCLYIEHLCLSIPDLGKLNWKPWKSLTVLGLKLAQMESPGEKDRLLELLSFLPCLVKLDLAETCMPWGKNRGPNNLDKLHSYLPRLSSLSIYVNHTDFDDDDYDPTAMIEPAINLTELNVTGPGIHLLWYIIRKYPNLRSLKTLSLEKGYNSNFDPQKLIYALGTLSHGFSFLRNIGIATKTSTKYHLEIWKQISLLNIKLRNIGLDLGRGDRYKEEDSETTFYRIVTPHANIVESLCINMKDEFMSPRIFMPLYSLQCYPCLVSLYLEIHNASYCLDVILNSCPELRTLSFSNAWLYISPGGSANDPKHGLKHIDLMLVDVYTSVLGYLSYRCRDLEHMSLDSAIIFDTFSKGPEKLCIDMSYTCFKYLLIRCIGFGKPRSDLYKKGDVSIMVLSESTIDPQLKNKKRSKAIVNNNALSKAPIKNTWYYISYAEETSGGTFSFMWKLRKHEIEFARKHFNLPLDNKNSYEIDDCTGPMEHYPGRRAFLKRRRAKQREFLDPDSDIVECSRCYNNYECEGSDCSDNDFHDSSRKFLKKRDFYDITGSFKKGNQHTDRRERWEKDVPDGYVTFKCGYIEQYKSDT